MSRRPKKPVPELGDRHLWSEVARTVRPLRNTRMIEPQRAAEPHSHMEPEHVKKGKIAPVASAANPPAPLTAPRKTPAATALIEPRLRRRLVRGMVPIDATIDLHGMRQIEAHAALHSFIGGALRRGHRTILVITGKGLKKTGYSSIEQRGILRSRLPEWLADPALAPFIAGWEVSARPHGGEGAYYVRLRAAR